MKIKRIKLFKTILFCGFLCSLFVAAATADEEDAGEVSGTPMNPDLGVNFEAPNFSVMAPMELPPSIPNMPETPEIPQMPNMPDIQSVSILSQNALMYQPVTNIIAETQSPLGFTEQEERRLGEGQNPTIMARLGDACKINPVEQNPNLAMNMDVKLAAMPEVGNVVADTALNLPAGAKYATYNLPINVPTPMQAELPEAPVIRNASYELPVGRPEIMPTNVVNQIPIAPVAPEASQAGGLNELQQMGIVPSPQTVEQPRPLSGDNMVRPEPFSGQLNTPVTVPDNITSQIPAGPVLPAQSERAGLGELREMGILSSPKTVEQSLQQPGTPTAITGFSFSETPVIPRQNELPSLTSVSLDTSTEPGFFRRAFNWVIDGIYSIGGGISSIFSGIGGAFTSNYSPSVSAPSPVDSSLGMPSNLGQQPVPTGPDSLYSDAGRLSSGATSVYDLTSQPSLSGPLPSYVPKFDSSYGNGAMPLPREYDRAGKWTKGI